MSYVKIKPSLSVRRVYCVVVAVGSSQEIDTVKKVRRDRPGGEIQFPVFINDKEAPGVLRAPTGDIETK